MSEKLRRKASRYRRRYRRRNALKKLLSFLGCVVVFCTTYALILPAITKERETFCDTQEHMHESSCYTLLTAQERELICTLDALFVHVHDDACFDEAGINRCGQADYVVHTHDEACFDENNMLLCRLPQAGQHEHGEACYREVLHMHDENCFASERGELICTIPDAHVHEDACFVQGETLLCAEDENHVHDQACYAAEKQLLCGYAQEHEHSEACQQIVREQICAYTENHEHTDACYGDPVLICGHEGEHQHGDACYVRSDELTCLREAHHEHGDACYEQEQPLICTQAAHVHSESCMVQGHDLLCEKDEYHEHGDACYEQSRPLICGHTAHAHDDSCMVQGEQLLCRLDENHEHGGDCYTERQLVCSEEEEHEHSDACFSERELCCDKKEGHSHRSDCYNRVLGCGGEAHEHDDGCYGERALLCSRETGHAHSAACYNRALGCSSETHEHDDGCYGERALLCTKETGHEHGDACYALALGCGEEAHEHSDACYGEGELICTDAQNHVHDAQCYIEQQAGCTQTAHKHSDECYGGQSLICEKEEAHVHSAACFERICRCDLPENHEHDDACFAQAKKLTCQIEEGTTAHELVCMEPQAQVHSHTEACFAVMPLDLTCTLGDEHEHKEHCYGEWALTCDQMEHAHDPNCYSDRTADLETRATWEKSMAHVKLTDVWPVDVLNIARSQMGYRESSRNYVVDSDGETIRGYTRYGEWYGASHSDWCAMFASFCLHYAKVEGVPYEAHCQRWIEKLSDPSVNLYRTAGEYTPVPGDLIFFDFDGDQEADHVGFVEEIGDKIKTIEGNSENRVRNVTYELDDEAIMGYGMLPVKYNQKQELMNQPTADNKLEPEETLVFDVVSELEEDTEVLETYCGVEAHKHTELCYNEAGGLNCELAEHEHGEACFEETEELPEIIEAYCGIETHKHTELCYNEAGELNCELAEHEHSGVCFEEAEEKAEEENTKPLCGFEVHLHGATCYNEAGELLCMFAEHEHGQTCYGEFTEVTDEAGEEVEEEILIIYCGIEAHKHTELCYDEAGLLICELAEHVHSEACFEEVEEEEIPEIIETYCGIEAHKHTESCYDEAGELICELAEHEHSDACCVEAKEEILITYCGLEAHEHNELCYDEAGLLICEIQEHEHSDACYVEPVAATYCGIEAHKHTELCYDEAGLLICELTEHEHSDACYVEPVAATYCGLEEHAHGEACCNEAGELICELAEHQHNITCGVDLRDLSDELRQEAIDTMLAIKRLPSADEIDEKLMEYEAVGDYAGEEEWLMQVYQQVFDAYRSYARLPAWLQERIIGREKLLEMEYIWCMAPLADAEIAGTIKYNEAMFTDGAQFVLYTKSGDQYYAFDSSGAAVPITINAQGMIVADEAYKNSLLWTFTKSGSGYQIRSVSSTNRYMYATSGGVTSTTRNVVSTLEETEGGVRVRGNNYYATLNTGDKRFYSTQNAADAAVYQFGAIYNCTVWLDGSCGGLESYSGSPDTGHLVTDGSFTLPTEWASPTGYRYTLVGWYDIINRQYYAPGSEVDVYENMVFYADWTAQTYNIGRMDEHVVETVSTNEFITTHLFDYDILFNIPSVSAQVNVSSTSHDETWSMSDAAAPYDYIFRSWDPPGMIAYPSGSENDNNNTYHDNNITYNLYSAERANILFGTGNAFDPETGEGILGKEYIGRGDHLFQFGTDPGDQYYGYYYYDSHRNAASYNRSAGRFYVYDYYERTDESRGADLYDDFLPLNSIYANYSGTPDTYTHNGKRGYTYNDPGVNFWFGMRSEIEFFLPNAPGTTVDGGYGNQSMYGDDMIFEFSGDDDVWVLIDGSLVLDIGGIHQAKTGTIDFSKGTVNGSNSSFLRGLSPGTHKLTILYLERGSSHSNCLIRFNLSPRYALDLQKEDVLNRDQLNGAEFSVYTDSACTTAAKLWPSQAAFERDEDAWTNVFTVENGKASMWGLAAGNTYYIRETKAPPNYNAVSGVIKMTLGETGVASYEVLPDSSGADPSTGFTVHGFKVDFEKQEAYLVITNSKYGDEATSVHVRKKWNDAVNHDSDKITVYLLANGVRIREETLSKANNWEYTFTNLPKYMDDTGQTPVEYTVQEGTVPGYVGHIEAVTSSSGGSGTGGGTGGETTWVEVSQFQNGKVYLLKTGNLYMSDWNRNNWFDSTISSHTRWVAKNASGNRATLTNEAGATLYFFNSTIAVGYPGSAPTLLTYQNGTLGFERDQVGWDAYICGFPESNNIWLAGDGKVPFVLLEEQTAPAEPEQPEVPEGAKDFLITNTPVGEQEMVSLTVNKLWNHGTHGTLDMYQERNIIVRLMRGGVDTGMTMTLNLRNGWSGTFSNLPKYDEKDQLNEYSVIEESVIEGWSPQYGALVQTGNNAYAVTVTNVCTLTYMLPETGSGGTHLYTAGGLLLTCLAGIALIFNQRRRRRDEYSS